MSTARIVIVEDNALARDNLKLLLSGEPGLSVVGAFGSGEEALAALPGAKPELMLCDLGLPGMSGIDLIQKAKELFPDLDIMAHTICEDRDVVFSAIKAGASGYLVKGATPRELVEALSELRAGGAPMSPRIARSVIKVFQGAGALDEHLLSVKEKAVLVAVAEGLSYKEISTKLHISPHTVHSHIKKIYEKLQAKDKQEALAKARRKGIL